jgi:hypothetical protein
VIYPNGGSQLAPTRRDVTANTTVTEKRQDVEPYCEGFVSDSDELAKSDSVKVSTIIDCLNGQTDCAIGEKDQTTTTISTTFSADAGGGIKGVDIGASFGEEVTFVLCLSLECLLISFLIVHGECHYFDTIDFGRSKLC